MFQTIRIFEVYTIFSGCSVKCWVPSRTWELLWMPKPILPWGYTLLFNLLTGLIVMVNTQKVWLLKGAIQTGSVMWKAQVQILKNLTSCKNALNRTSLTILFPYLSLQWWLYKYQLCSPGSCSAELAETKGRTCACCWEAEAPVPWNLHHQIHHRSSLLKAADACARFGMGIQPPEASGPLLVCQAHSLSFPPSTSHLKVPFWLLPLQLTVISG